MLTTATSNKTPPSGTTARGAIISFENVSKRFGSARALTDVTFSAIPSSVHAITGENGAGKSTLMKILAGVHKVTSGNILYKGKPIHFSGPAAALRAGISTVFQELTLLPNPLHCRKSVSGARAQKERIY